MLVSLSYTRPEGDPSWPQHQEAVLTIDVMAEPRTQEDVEALIWALKQVQHLLPFAHQRRLEVA